MIWRQGYETENNNGIDGDFGFGAGGSRYRRRNNEVKMRKDTKSFKASAEYDLQSAESMLASGRYIYVVFICHLSIEKMLKAIVAEAIKKIPPKTHNLIYLIKLAEINLPQELFDFITKINNASIVTRYPEDFPKLLEAYPEDVVKGYLTKTKEVIRCLQEDKRLKE